jgi:hypothetical protein
MLYMLAMKQNLVDATVLPTVGSAMPAPRPIELKGDIARQGF